MPPKKALPALGGWEVLFNLPDELTLSYQCNSEDFEQTLYSSSAYISRESCFTLAMCIPEVSQFHARVEWDDKTRKWKIKDLGSTGGTKVNGRKVRSDRFTSLKNGDAISISGIVQVKVKVAPLKEGSGKERMASFIKAKKFEIRSQTEEEVKKVKTRLEEARARGFEILDANET